MSYSFADQSADLLKRYSAFGNSAYVVDVEFDDLVDLRAVNRVRQFKEQVVYISRERINTSKTHVFSIGFFEQQVAAVEFAKAQADLAIKMTVRRASVIEQQAVIAGLAGDGETGLESYILSSRQSSSALLNVAKAHFVAGEYALASAHYRVLQLVEDEGIAKWALELLALSEERQGHFNVAIAVYNYFLKIYPDGVDATRVSQRLTALQTASNRPKASLRAIKPIAEVSPFRTNGLFVNNIRSSHTSDPGATTTIVQSTNIDLKANYSQPSYKVTAHLSGDGQLDIGNSENNRIRLREANVSYTHEYSQFSATLGKQKNRLTGSFVPYTGVTLNYPVSEKYKIGIAGGIPDYQVDVYKDLQYLTYAAFVNARPNDRLAISGYTIVQKVESVTDRSGLGGAIAFKQGSTLNSLNFDYDTTFAAFNTLLLRTNFSVQASTKIGVTLGYQRTPLLLATNVKSSAPELDLEIYLNDPANNESLYQEAAEKSDVSRYLSLTHAYKVDSTLTLTSDAYVSMLTDSDTSAAAIDDQLYWSLGSQAAFTKLGGWDHATNIRLKLASADSYNSATLSLSEHLKIKNGWTIAPKSAVTLKSLSDSNDTQIATKLSTTVVYKPNRYREFKVEGGIDFLHLMDSDAKSNTGFLSFNFLQVF